MSALDDYVAAHANELSLDLGSITGNLKANPDNARAWVRFSLGLSKQIWASLPADIRTLARQGLQQVIDDIEAVAELAISSATDALIDAAGIADAIPIVGAIIQAAVQLIVGIVDAVRDVRQLDSAYSVQDKNIEQFRTFEAVTSPNAWAIGLYSVRNYKYYASKANRVDGVAWRSRPSIVPSYRDAVVWGLPTPPAPLFSCNPGRELNRKGAGYDFEAGAGQYCESFAAISALFWPFYSPNHKAQPIKWYGKEVYPENAPFKLDGVDPNEILIVRQQALLSNPETNLRVRGSRLQAAERTFSQYFRDKVEGLGGMMELRGNEIKLRRTPDDDGPVERFKIDSQFVPSHEPGGSTHFYWNRNGMIASYGHGPDLGDVGVPAFCPPDRRGTLGPDLGYSAAQLNTIVSAVKGFFAARVAMLQQPYFMRFLLDEHPARRYFDPRVQAAMVESASRV